MVFPPMQREIKCMMMRGGTSKGAYFVASDLPADPVERDRLLLSVMGSPDPRQIDGIGGAHPLTSKVAIVSRSTDPSADIDFLFAQVGVDEAKVDTTPNCGNILAGVGPFALERGLFPADDPETPVRVRTVNTGTLAELIVSTPGGRVQYAGEEHIDGVPGTAAPVTINFLDAEGSMCGSLLPTGKVCDRVAGVAATLIDNGMPVVVVAAADLGCTGHEDCAELESNRDLCSRIEEIRLESGRLMGLGDVSTAVVPKVALVSAPMAGGIICTRSFIPKRCHASIGVFAAVSVATACVLPGSTAHALAQLPSGRVKRMAIEHPGGLFEVRLVVGGTTEKPHVERAGLVRTARALFDGVVFAHDETAA
jgi:4-oxalomesaconate tautomerase